MTTILPLDIPALRLLKPFVTHDERGFLCEPYNRDVFTALGITDDFAQDLVTVSGRRGTLRGLHFQSAPFGQSKLVRVGRGAIFDVAVDLRAGSATYGRHVGLELSATNGEALYIPVGFAHGFVTLEADTEVVYKIAGAYAPAYATGCAWNDPDLAIAWPIPADEIVISQRDRELPHLRDLNPAFADRAMAP